MGNKTVRWVNNSRLLMLATPDGTPPPGGWPVILDFAVIDFHYGSVQPQPHQRGWQQRPSGAAGGRGGGGGPRSLSNTCGSEGITPAPPVKPLPLVAPSCAAEAGRLCGDVFNASFSQCVGGTRGCAGLAF